MGITRGPRPDGVMPLKYQALMAAAAGAAAARPVTPLLEDARCAGASEAEIAEALAVGARFGQVETRRAGAQPSVGLSLQGNGFRRSRAGWVAAVCTAALVFAAVAGAPPGRADGCGDGGSAPAGGCPDPGAPPQAGLSRPAWLGAIQQRDPQFAESYSAMRERILRDGAIPAKYKLLMAMVTDAIAAHPDGVRTLAGNARAAGASEPEVTEAVEVGYLFGGTAALVMGSNAFTG
ncbi:MULTISPECIES: carboxymuconolactone decarboxylase family protein [unclassified Mycobacterium]|uniref:carboxymuconolactone decarboxylase family protein n=1 Tax=unclassified Mycobacterium TaxID=2642494 RepID=UPI0009EE82E1|nr:MULTISPECIES: carboxymuconolactone decarboxylase family protein [unclassified Mycobacterium]